MARTRIHGQQVTDGSIELVDLSSALASTISGKADAGNLAPVATSGSYNDLTNLPTLFSGAYADLTGKPTLFSGDYADLSNKPSLFDGNYSSLSGAPVLSTVATSGSYNDLSNLPTLFSGSYTDLTNKPILFSGSYNDLSDKPSIPSIVGLATETYVDTKVADLVASAPAVLDTLNELAAALGDDANFATTVAGQIGDVAGDVAALDIRVTAAEGDITSLQADVATKADSASLAAVATSGSYNDLINLPSLFDGNYSSLVGAPSLATVATSGSYNDLSNLPTLFSGDYADLSNKPTLFSGSYNDLSDKPTLGSLSGSLDDLSDVSVSSASSGDIIVHNGTNFVNSKSVSSDLTINSHTIGRGAGNVGSNVAFGINALAATTGSSSQNVAIGAYAGDKISSGSDNVFIGYGTGNNCTSGLGNIAIGKGANVSAGSAGAVAIGFGSVASGNYGTALGANSSAAANCLDLRFGNATRISGDANGQIGINEASPGAQLQVTSGAAARKGLIVKGAASQTANLFEVKNSSDVDLVAVAPDGGVNVKMTGNNTKMVITSHTSNSGNLFEFKWGGNNQNYGWVDANHILNWQNSRFYTCYATAVNYDITPLIAKGFQSSNNTAQVFEVQDSSATKLFQINNKGAAIHTTTDASVKPLVVKGAASQTANLFEAQNSSGTVLSSINSDGTFSGTSLNILHTYLSPTTTGVNLNGITSNNYIVGAGNARTLMVKTSGSNPAIETTNGTSSLFASSIYGVSVANVSGMSWAVGLVVNNSSSASTNIMKLQSVDVDKFVVDKTGAITTGIVPVARITGLATVATSGSYNDLSDTPSIPSIAGLATETYVDNAVAAVVNSAPEVLDTLNELAAALNDDPNFATTMTTALAAKADSTSLADVATSGSYVDLSNKPTIYTPVKEVFTSLVDGTETEFVLSDAPAVAGTEQVFVNGILQSSGAGDDYTISGDTITFNTAPEAGWKLIVYYFV